MNAIFSIGSNGSGQLGIGHKEDVSVPKPVILDSASPVIQVAAGGNHTLLLTASGEVYWSGDPSTGACGLFAQAKTPSFQKIKLAREEDAEPRGIALVAATWEASIVVARDATGKKSQIFTFGAGTKGELGSGELIVRTPTATRLKDFPPPETEIVDLVASMGHVVVVLSNGEAYGWGSCRKGQAGEPAGVIFVPRKIDGVDFPVRRAVCTKENTCLFGDPESGRLLVLGSDKWTLRSAAPSSAPSWKDVGASWGSIYILTKDGHLEAWGRDDHGQIPLPSLPRLKKVAVGSEHVVALSEVGDALCWGWGEHGNCGPRVENNDVKGRWNVVASSRFIPPGTTIGSIGAGCATTWICLTSS